MYVWTRSGAGAGSDPADSVTKPQVRLDPDVAEALQRQADDAERSLSTEANVWLRKALGIGDPGPRGMQGFTAPTLTGVATIAAPGGTDCPHPVTLRLPSGRCRRCGRTVRTL